MLVFLVYNFISNHTFFIFNQLNRSLAASNFRGKEKFVEDSAFSNSILIVLFSPLFKTNEKKPLRTFVSREKLFLRGVT
jgi:hypothetical protein